MPEKLTDVQMTAMRKVYTTLGAVAALLKAVAEREGVKVDAQLSVQSLGS